MKRAIVLCSGGIDSVVTARYVKKILNYEKILLMFFDYGQKGIIAERKCAKKCSKELDAEFVEIGLTGLKKISPSPLNTNRPISRKNGKHLNDTKKESETWYVPCRNLIFLSYAFSLAEAIKIKSGKKTEIFVGFKNDGKEFFPDASPEFLRKINLVGKTATVGKYHVLAPLIKKDKEDIILLGRKLKVDFEKTFSCYAGKAKHCGTCLACRLRQQGFYWANVKDPTFYDKKPRDLNIS